MVGTITNINSGRWMVAVHTEGAGYSIFELLSGADIEIGDSVQWVNYTGLGSEMITNRRTGKRVEALLQNHWVWEANLRRRLRLE
jgi:hypothetical protein